MQMMQMLSSEAGMTFASASPRSLLGYRDTGKRIENRDKEHFSFLHHSSNVFFLLSRGSTGSLFFLLSPLSNHFY